MPSRRLPDPALVLRDVLAVGVVILFGTLPFPADEFRAEGLALIPALLPAGLIPLRRRWPFIVFVAATLCAVVVAMSGTVSLGAMAAVVMSAFTIAERRSRLFAACAVAASVLVIFAANAVALHGDLFDPRAMQLLLFVVVGAALGDSTRSRRAFHAAMRERLEQAERSREDVARRRVAEERVRLARDLHDVVAHQIAIISLNAGVASSSLGADPERARTALQTVRAASRTVLADVGSMMNLLRDGDDGSATRPHRGIGAVGELAEHFLGLGLPVRIDRDTTGHPVPIGIDLLAYLVVQEGLTNAHKHGDGTEVGVRLRQTATTLAVILTNTPDQRQEVRAVGHGLRGLAERVDAVGGRLHVSSSASVFRLEAHLPLDDGTRTGAGA